MKARGVKHTIGQDDLKISDGTWIDLGQLRELVAKADALGWHDSSLVSAQVSAGTGHPRRHDVRVVHTLVIEGGR